MMSVMNVVQCRSVGHGLFMVAYNTDSLSLLSGGSIFKVGRVKEGKQSLKGNSI